MDFKFSDRKDYLYIELLRQLTVAQRLRIAGQMTAWEISRSRAEIARTNPEFTEEQVRLKWVENTYGKELAENLREYLHQRQVGSKDVNAAAG